MSTDELIAILLEIEGQLSEFAIFDDVFYYANKANDKVSAPITWYSGDFDEDGYTDNIIDLENELKSLPTEYKFMLEMLGVICE